MRGGGVEAEATHARIARAIAAAADGATTVLSCSGDLHVAAALAFAEQQRVLGRLERAVRLSVGHGRIHIEPRNRQPQRLRRVAGAVERRTQPDRRRGERRQRGPDDPAGLAVVALRGERRTGEDRRSGVERRRGARPLAAPDQPSAGRG